MYKLLKIKRFKKVAYILATAIFLFLLMQRFYILSSKYYYLAACDLNFDANDWQYLEGRGGIAEDGGILISFQEGARAQGRINLKKAKYALWMRFRAGPSLGDCQLLIDDKKFIISQYGKDIFLFKKIADLSLDEGEHFVFIRDVSNPENNITFDAIYFTTNLFFMPKFKSGLESVIYRKPFKYIYHGSLIFIYLCLYLMFIFFIAKGDLVFKSAKNYARVNIWAKDRTILYLFLPALMGLSLSLIFAIHKNEIVADIFAIIFYITLSLGAIRKTLNVGISNIRVGKLIRFKPQVFWPILLILCMGIFYYGLLNTHPGNKFFEMRENLPAVSNDLQKGVYLPSKDEYFLKIKHLVKKEQAKTVFLNDNPLELKFIQARPKDIREYYYRIPSDFVQEGINDLRIHFYAGKPAEVEINPKNYISKELGGNLYFLSNKSMLIVSRPKPIFKSIIFVIVLLSLWWGLIYFWRRVFSTSSSKATLFNTISYLPSFLLMGFAWVLFSVALPLRILITSSYLYTLVIVSVILAESIIGVVIRYKKEIKNERSQDKKGS